jgi:hypothetical protein
VFKPYQEVIVINLLNLRSDGAGKVIKLVTHGENKGKYLIEVAGGYVNIEPERIVDVKAYWESKREK